MSDPKTNVYEPSDDDPLSEESLAGKTPEQRKAAAEEVMRATLAEIGEGFAAQDEALRKRGFTEEQITEWWKRHDILMEPKGEDDRIN